MVKFIDDGIETDPLLFKNTINKDKLTLGWFGNRDKVDEILSFKRKLNIEDPLITISNSTNADYTMGYGCEKPWSIESLTEILLREIDIIIIPIDTSNTNNLVKSSNRLTLGMSLGIPTIASPIPSYQCVSSENIDSVFFAEYNDVNTWKKHIDFLRNEKNRFIHGVVARQTVIDRFSLQTITKEWILFILEILNKDIN
jgi:hypothetical protein